MRAQVFIKGVVRGSSNNKLLIYSPINGIANNTLVQDGSSIAIDSLGRFQYALDLKDPCFVELRIENEPVWLFLEPHDSLQIQINLDSISTGKHTGWLHIRGDNSEGHLFYNEFNYQPITKLLPVMELFQAIKKQPVDLLRSMQDTIAKALIPFGGLLAAHKISSAYYKLVSTSIKANLLNEGFKYFFRGSSLYSVYSNNVIDSLKKGLFAMCDPLDTILYKGHNTSFYLYDYYLQQELASKGKWLEKDLKDSALITSSGKKTLVQGGFTPFLHISDQRLRENLWAMLLYGIAESSGTSVDQQSVAAFRDFHPNSTWLPYINHLEEEVSKLVKKSQGDAKERIYLDSVQAITSLQEIADKVKGKPLFIDLWASWCAPCRQEFLSKNALDSFLKAKGIAKVYISVDNAMAKESWTEAITLYNLKGYHVLSSRPLMEELRQKVYRAKEKNFPIPRYVIVNSRGQIVEQDALRPSSDQQLIKQIKKVLLLN